MRRLFHVLCLLLPLLTGGCVTHKLWTEAEMDEWNEPAANPNLRLFQDVKQSDFLVVYDEYSDRDYTIQSRAYFLRQSREPLGKHLRPYFVNTNSACRLPSVPVFCLKPTNAPVLPYAVIATNGGSYTIFSANDEAGTYSLPSYNDGVGRIERIAWTPLTVTADITIVGGVLVLICWDMLGQSGGTSISAH